MSDQPSSQCLICLSVVSSGLGRYPFRCANGHTLYRGGGAAVDWEHGMAPTVPSWAYRPPTRREVVSRWARNQWPDWPSVTLGEV